MAEPADRGGKLWLGRRLRRLREERGLTQAALAAQLSISPSYLNLIENERRPLPQAILSRLTEAFALDARGFDPGSEARLRHDLEEVFADPLFESHPVSLREQADAARAAPELARAVVRLYHAWRVARSEPARAAAARDGDAEGGAPSDLLRLSSEQVSDLIQSHKNHFPELEAEAERLRQDAGATVDDAFGALARHLERTHRVEVRIEKVSAMGGLLRRYDVERRVLHLSEGLRRGSRNFQLAHQAALLECGPTLGKLAADPLLTGPESRALARVALANYLAAAVLMPYADFLAAAEEERYDLDLLGHRFRTSFEQVAHRLTTLGREGARGVPFHLVRVDIAGNVSKTFSATRVRFPRFFGLCPLWDVHQAFLRPGFIRVQISRFPDGTRTFQIARTVRKHRGGYHSRNVLHAIDLGCELADAHRLVYADGHDLAHTPAAVPVGTTCRLCERLDCEARAAPPVHLPLHPLHVDENVLGPTYYVPKFGGSAPKCGGAGPWTGGPEGPSPGP